MDGLHFVRSPRFDFLHSVRVTPTEHLQREGVAVTANRAGLF